MTIYDTQDYLKVATAVKFLSRHPFTVDDIYRYQPSLGSRLVPNIMQVLCSHEVLKRVGTVRSKRKSARGRRIPIYIEA